MVQAGQEARGFSVPSPNASWLLNDDLASNWPVVIVPPNLPCPRDLRGAGKSRYLASQYEVKSNEPIILDCCIPLVCQSCRIPENNHPDLFSYRSDVKSMARS